MWHRHYDYPSSHYIYYRFWWLTGGCGYRSVRPICSGPECACAVGVRLGDEVKNFTHVHNRFEMSIIVVSTV